MFTKEQLLEVYDYVVCYRPEYKQMIKKIARTARGRTLEVGAGTGLLTQYLLKNRTITKLVLIDPDVLFIKKFKEKFSNINILRKDGLTFRSKHKFNYIVMSLVYHHIPDNMKIRFLQNMRRNMHKGGMLIIGDMFLLPYKNRRGKDYSLCRFYKARIQQAENDVVKKIERQTFMDGLKRNGEYKMSREILERQLKLAGFKNIKVTDIGKQDTGGYKIVTAQANH